MHSEPPTHIKTNRYKNRIDDKSDPEPWSYCEIINTKYIDTYYKYCYIGSAKQKESFPFIRYDLFLPYTKLKNEERIAHYNSPEALILTQYVDFIKMNNGCIECGYKEDSKALLFDHINPIEKNFEISDMLNKYRKTSIKNRPHIFAITVEEMKKCQVMCCNCHAKKTFDNKCGIEKLKKHYNSPEDFLLKNNKLPTIYLTLESDEYFAYDNKVYNTRYKHIIENKELILL